MSKIIFTFSGDGQIFDVGSNNKIMIIEDVGSYKSELCDIIEDNKLSFVELKRLVESLGGKIDMVLLSQLVNLYKKNI